MLRLSATASSVQSLLELHLGLVCPESGSCMRAIAQRLLAGMSASAESELYLVILLYQYWPILCEFKIYFGHILTPILSLMNLYKRCCFATIPLVPNIYIRACDGIPVNMDAMNHMHHVRIYRASPGICLAVPEPVKSLSSVKLISRKESPIDVHISKLVKSLNLAGMRTNSSCEGHEDPSKPSFPYVDFTDVQHGLGALIAQFNETDPIKWQYVPGSSLSPSPLARHRLLAELQESAERLADFLFTNWLKSQLRDGAARDTW